MRQIFSSPRLENVETVQSLLEDAGIATRVTNKSTWNRATKRDFSYSARDSGGTWPALWVIEADDYPKARELLREHGIAMPTTRAEPTFAPSSYASARPEPSGIPTAMKIRYGLLAVCIVGATVVGLRIAGVL